MHDDTREIACTIALSRLPHVGMVIGRRLIEAAGSATALYQHRHSLRDLMPDVSARLAEAVAHFDDEMPAAEREVDFMIGKNIEAFVMSDHRYPARLLECHDAPLVLFGLGAVNANPRHVISIVGSRRNTAYGRDMCRCIIRDLAQQVPDLLVVSGLAYGIDICAHREALANNVPTIAVLAHGLDRIYPAAHRTTAVQMLDTGGLITEYVCGTTPDRMNFVRRNRIVAGMSDVTLVVESGEQGGSLITADIALSYDREVVAVPGRATDEMSRGCNNLIARQQAHMVQTAEDIMELMNWADKTQPKSKQKEPTLFPDLTSDEERILAIMEGCDSIQINAIVAQSGMPYSAVSLALYELEYKGVVELLGGARYRMLHN